MAKTWCSARYCTNNPKKTPLNSFHRFPKDSERCAQWIQATGRDDLRNKSPDYLYKNCRICSDHFDKSQILCTGRLVWNAVPTVRGFPKPTSKCKQPTGDTDTRGTEGRCGQGGVSLVMHVRDILNDVLLSSAVIDEGQSIGDIPVSLAGEERDVPLSSEVSDGDLNQSLALHQEAEDHRYARATETPSYPSDSVPTEIPSEPISHVLDYIDPNTSLHINSKSTQTDPEAPPSTAEVATLCCLTKSTDRVKIFRLKNKIKLLKANSEKTKRKPISVKEIVKESEKYLDEITLHFFASQLEIGRTKTKGRRYSSKDKRMAYALLCQSTATYRFYRKLKLFALPSERSLRRWLTKVQGQPDLYDDSFAALKLRAQTMSERLRAAVKVFNQDLKKRKTERKKKSKDSIKVRVSPLRDTSFSAIAGIPAL